MTYIETSSICWTIPNKPKFGKILCKLHLSTSSQGHNHLKAFYAHKVSLGINHVGFLKYSDKDKNNSCGESLEEVLSVLVSL